MLKFAIAASATTLPGGPSWVKRAVPVRLRVTPNEAVFVLDVCPAGIVTANVASVVPDVSRRVSVPLRLPPVVFCSE